ncbi:MAG: T9SS type A sorting domain-containing protein, partial [Cyclonatronaceae bacterium]
TTQRPPASEALMADGAAGYIRIELSGNELHDSAWIGINPEGVSGEKSRRDAWQLSPLSEDYVLLASEKTGVGLMDIGQYPASGQIEIPLIAEVTEPGVYTFKVTDYELNGQHLYLNDLETGANTLIEPGATYTVELSGSKAGTSGAEQDIAVLGSKPVKYSLSEKQPARFTISSGAPTSVPDGNELPSTVSLAQNYPNPFNPTTQISYELPESAEVRLDVFNVMGQRVATLVHENRSAGAHDVKFDASNLSSGVYLYRLSVGSSVLTRKMTLIK